MALHKTMQFKVLIVISLYKVKRSQRKKSNRRRRKKMTANSGFCQMWKVSVNR